MDPNFEGRVLVIANRLPITIKDTQDGNFEYNISSGGLVSGLRSLAKAVDFKWFGWPGIDIHRNDKDKVRRDLQDKFNAYPIFLNEQMAQAHYNGFSNSVLWPLLHRMPEKVRAGDNWSAAYQHVNEIFADNIVPMVEDDDLIWVHDYHLLLLPGILRERLSKKKNIKIGFFLHTPFPTDDYFTILPLREEICRSLLLCDVVGFHTQEYADDFLNSASLVLEGVSRSPADLHWGDRKVIVHGFPIGIEPESFRQQMKSDRVKGELTKLKHSFEGRKIILGVDRLDYIKGIPQKLMAFDRFLTEHPEWVSQVCLIQLAIPTRAEVDTYKELRKEVEALVGHINGKHGTFSSAPIHYIYRSIEPELLCALYAAADVCIISSIRDGLNMVSYEYIACQNKDTAGVLMMSYYAGAVKTLPATVVVNPWDRPRFANTIEDALEMPIEERRRRFSQNVDVVERCTSVRWGTSFLNTLYIGRLLKRDELPDLTQQVKETDNRTIKSTHILQERSRSRETDQ
ncbi:alpha,alpha-trehalose-phosphate synthase (UDP-forming) [Exophiala spinifera]|uniref:Alpha,alpha-trehalose-phosphate synthase (UDP-forming) n=1 Tax=Exophiala spinifera TaxID=91928 RepID=A0A0D2BNV9_9EURO|nr:alpha,alpha-trehalose-phosphate synthase (UDP-forming) [Exophiala spinifera]KIW20588.1 alpha,alpha-trehalose-phosphate synthase (UDP-forming) [Exophiala spinifera]